MSEKEGSGTLLQSLGELLAGEGPPDPVVRVEALRGVIEYLDRKYYLDAEQVIPDADYDHLFRELRRLEIENPELLTPDSPTQRVARGLSEGFSTVTHATAMLSLENSYNAADLHEWDRRVKNFTGAELPEYSVEPKFDGSSISLQYRDGVLIRGATRGDGVQGEDITNNVKVIRSVPLRAGFEELGVHLAEVRGEVVIAKDVFRLMNEAREAEGLPRFQNPRNTAAGGLRMKDPGEVAQRGMETFVFHLGFATDRSGEDLLSGTTPGFSTHSGNLAHLEKLGFRVPGEAMKVVRGIEEVQRFIETWEKRRDEYAFEIDGMVIKVNDLGLQRRCGSTAHHPRWAIAYKFKAKQATSRLLNVEFQIGRTGAITPVAKLEPVSLAGVTISSVSLHNQDQIAEKDIRIGDLVRVERAGDVIPYIAGVVAEARNGSEKEIVFPPLCPSCQSELVRAEGEVAVRCVNADCPAQAEERLIHYVSKDAMDVDGLGKDIVRRFYQEGLLRAIPELYRLDFDRILALDGWGEKAVANLQRGVETSKNQPLFRLINALGIRHVGVTTAKALARRIDDLVQLASMSREDLMEVEDIGPVVAGSITEFFANPANQNLIGELRELGVNTRTLASEKPGEGVLSGKTYLFTGTLLRLSRDQAKVLVERHGGRNLSGISSNLDVLVVGEKAGSKLKKAREIGTIRIMTEDEFLQLTGETATG